MDLDVKVRALCAELGDVCMQLKSLRAKRRALEAELEQVAGMRNAIVLERQSKAEIEARVAAGVRQALDARKRKRKETSP